MQWQFLNFSSHLLKAFEGFAILVFHMLLTVKVLYFVLKKGTRN